MKEGLVSIVTPVYNGERYVGRFLESVLAQTWEQLEVFLVDDGSEDRSIETARSFQPRFQARGIEFRVLAAQHKNASAALNQALPLVTGEFLIWPDSDDVLDPESIRRRAAFLQANPQYQCVRSLSRYRNEDGTPGVQQERVGPLDCEDLFLPVLMGESFVCCGCYMLRSEAFFAIYPERRIPEYGVGQNFQMLLPFLYAHRCPTLREELYTVYVRPDSHSRRPLTRREEEVKYSEFERLVDEIADICRITDPEIRFQMTLWKQRRRYSLALRHGQRRRALPALLWLCAHGDFGLARTGKEMIKLVCGARICQAWNKLTRR